MSSFETLIKELCPNGVEYRNLNELFIQFNGMTGVSKKWANEGNCVFVDYMNVYKNIKVDVNRLENATVSKLTQNILKKCDILLTSASETPDECAISSVIEDDIADNVFLDDHLFGIRLKEESMGIINTSFINYYFHCNKFRKELNKAVRGVTRFYLSNEAFMKLEIPVPPIEVQDEIVRILDNFTNLTAELTAELTARKKQYEYYRDDLLTFKRNVRIVKLYEICDLSAGGDVPKDDFSNVKTEKYCVPIYSNGIGEKSLYGYTSKAKINKKSVTVASRGTIGYCSLRKEPYYPVIRLISVIPKDDVLAEYLYHFLSIVDYKVPSTGIPQLTIPMIKNIDVYLPSLEVQEKIVNVLDNFEKICNDLKIGLPAEIELRKKQYEYYRDLLLTFPERGFTMAQASKQASKQAS